jgi:hypothetical protein
LHGVRWRAFRNELSVFLDHTRAEGLKYIFELLRASVFGDNRPIFQIQVARGLFC